ADCLFFFFFQAEDGIRDLYVTGVQTCALPISRVSVPGLEGRPPGRGPGVPVRKLARRALHHRPSPSGDERLARGRRLRARLQTRAGRGGAGREAGARRGGGAPRVPPVPLCARGTARGLVDPPVRAKLERDFDRFKRELPRDFPAHVRETYGIDLTARYLAPVVPHPIGKGSGQLALNTGKVEDDATAGSVS